MLQSSPCKNFAYDSGQGHKKRAANQTAKFGEFYPLTNLEKNKIQYQIIDKVIITKMNGIIEQYLNPKQWNKLLTSFKLYIGECTSSPLSMNIYFYSCYECVFILAEGSENLNLEDLFKQFAAQMPLRGYRLLQVCDQLVFCNLIIVLSQHIAQICFYAKKT